VLLIAAGIAALLDTTNTATINIEGALAVGLGVVGAALLLSAWYGRARMLVPLGIALTAALGAISVTNVPLTGGIGQRDYHPTAASELRKEYHLAIGQMTLDLRDAPFVDHTRTIEATVGMGELRVQVPSTVTVEVRAHAGGGDLTVFGQDDGGWDVDSNRRVRGTHSGTVRLDLEVGMGHVLVERFSPDNVETIPGGN
jgi:hypothetical protein